MSEVLSHVVSGFNPSINLPEAWLAPPACAVQNTDVLLVHLKIGPAFVNSRMTRLSLHQAQFPNCAASSV
ncbi:MAG: hypothetical protein IPG80_15505 [Anaerolineales bacterium]|uniref:hypothetical protein n=1 Tax=Candidatus Villigracilis vicinus TaxID=3140679 RepID=UPI003135A6A7|nr:hypothetical protein [Anaerolineales bacterium]